MPKTRRRLRGLEFGPESCPEDTVGIWSDGMKPYPAGFHLGPPSRDEPVNWNQVLSEIIDVHQPTVVFIEPLVSLLGPAIDDYSNRHTNVVLRKLRAYENVRWFVGHHESKARETASGKAKSAQQRIRGGTAIPAVVDRHLSLTMGKGGETRVAEFGKARGQFTLPKNFEFKADVDIEHGKAKLEIC